jgi:peptide/nickel transport system permease protein
MGTDRPLIVQYGVFMSQLAQGDFGTSTQTHQPASHQIMQRFPATLQLASIAVIIGLLIAIPAGAFSASHRRSRFDNIARGWAILGQSMPMFWTGILLIFIFSAVLDLLPPSGRGGPMSFIMPAVTLGYFIAAGIMRLTRSGFLDVLDSEYIKFARIKGLSERMVIWKHAFRNAALPVLTFSATMFIRMLAGSIIVETVFSWPGVGSLMMHSVRYRDFAMIQGIVIILSALYLFGNLVLDLTYAYLNPRIRYGGDAQS